MTTVGKVASVWRYPVKSMRGEEMPDAFVAFGGIYGDRVCAFHSSAARAGFPYLTGRELPRMLLYQPVFCNGETSRRPANLSDAEALSPGITPVYDDQSLEVRTPEGDVFAIDDRKLMERLLDGLGDVQLRLLRSDRAMTDCRPVSLCSLQTVEQLGNDVAMNMDKRRFRANIYADFDSPFAEERFVGSTLKIGEKVQIAVLARDPRCKMITLDPETGAAEPKVMRHVSKDRDGKVGIYCAVLTEGIIRPGDVISVN